ncbi:MAG: diguanylate cyclase, partial [Candidatus Omnitrophica bacterium]|nr:diguanylate cyclase [Candidatus Omnitrophota bacterium]
MGIAMEDKKLQIQLEKTKAELRMLYEIGNAMMTTLKLDELLYIILTAVTAKEGLGFNRAMLFLINDEKNTIEGKMGIGPKSGEDAHKIWTGIESEQKTLEDLIYSYHLWELQKNSPLSQAVKEIKLPFSEEGGIIALTCLEGMTFEITTEEARTKLNDPILNHLKADLFLTVPLKTKNKAIGAILADNIFSKKPILKDDVKMLTMFANQAGFAIENSRLYEQTLLLSNIDSLTRVWNHGRFQAVLAEELIRAKEVKIPVSLIMLDVDYFKNYNDNLGHQAGDMALKTIARLIRNNLRAADPV